jgi:hypothetical protein
MNNYPRYDSSRISSGTCALCGLQKADTRIRVEVNVFSGDDEIYIVHERCIKEKSPEEVLQALGFKLNF